MVVTNAIPDQLRDKCCHMAIMIENIDKARQLFMSEVIMNAAMSPFAKLLWRALIVIGLGRS